jgi:hypothetical protein
MPCAGLEDDDVDPFLRQLVAERSTARTGADDHDDAIVVLVELCGHSDLPSAFSLVLVRA